MPKHTTIPRKWTPEEDRILLELYLTHERVEIARILGRTGGSIRKRCSVLGLNHKRPAITEEQLDTIMTWYQEHTGRPLELEILAKIIGMDIPNISREARKMGLTNQSIVQSESAKSKIGSKMKSRITENGHPRGMLGKKHSEETRRVFSQRSSERAKMRTPLDTEVITQKQLKTKIERYGTGRPGWMTSSNAYSRTKSGKRADLDNRFFRSSWEANYARYLNFLKAQGEIVAWEYESQTFVFHGVTRGQLTYTPDFKLIYADGSYEWHEVKGWMDDKSKAKLKRMAKFYPDEKVIVIGPDEYKAVAKWKALIGDWE
jgi:hypothetical protein